jgi:hypothetical protein
MKGGNSEMGEGQERRGEEEREKGEKRSDLHCVVFVSLLYQSH